MCDTFFIVGDARLFSVMVALCALAMFMTGVVAQYQDMTNKLFVLKYIGQIKYRTVRYPLNNENNKIFIIKFNLISKYMMIILFWVTTITSFITVNTTLVIAYTHYNFELKIFPLIFWSIIFILFLEQAFGILWFGSPYGMPALYICR